MLIRWTLKNLLRESGSLVAGAGGIALSLLLVLLIDGMFAGEAERIVAYLRRTDADVWVMQRGVANLHMAASLFHADLRVRVGRVPGVASTTPVLYVSTFMEVGPDTALSYVVGLPPEPGPGGPWAMAAGRARPAAGEAVIPDVLAARSQVAIGDTIALLGRRFTVTGVSAGTYSMANSITFVSFADLAELLSAPRGTSYLLVQGDGSVSADALAERIRTNVPAVNAVPRDVLVESDRRLALQMGVELIRIMTVVGVLVATLIIAFAVYAATARRRRELGIAKALGVRASGLYLTVLLHALVLVALGFTAALGLAHGLRPVLERIAPEIALEYPAAHVAALALWTPVVASLAAMPPVRLVARVDPYLVFHE